MNDTLRAGDRIVLTGDSITEWGRDHADPASLGHGYVGIVAALLGARHPELDLTFANRGVGADTAARLRSRWADDVLSLDPTLISVMIGINDTWRRYDEGTPTTTEEYEEHYRAVLDAAVDHGVRRFVLVEPFLAPVSPDQELWWEDLEPRITVVRHLAAEHDAVLVPASGIFRAAAGRTTARQWCADGVHPTAAGHGLIAEAWLAAVA